MKMMMSCNNNPINVPNSDSAVQRLNQLDSTRSVDGSTFGQQSCASPPSIFPTHDFSQYNQVYIAQKSSKTIDSLLKVLQWNLNGYINNYHELELLIKYHNPEIISLQETHLLNNLTPKVPKQYEIYLHNITTSAKQGTGLLIHKSIPHKRLQINSNISAVAVED